MPWAASQSSEPSHATRSTRPLSIVFPSRRTSTCLELRQVQSETNSRVISGQFYPFLFMGTGTVPALFSVIPPPAGQAPSARQQHLITIGGAAATFSPCSSPVTRPGRLVTGEGKAFRHGPESLRNVSSRCWPGPRILLRDDRPLIEGVPDAIVIDERGRLFGRCFIRYADLKRFDDV